MIKTPLIRIPYYTNSCYSHITSATNLYLINSQLHKKPSIITRQTNSKIHVLNHLIFNGTNTLHSVLQLNKPVEKHLDFSSNSDTISSLPTLASSHPTHLLIRKKNHKIYLIFLYNTPSLASPSPTLSLQQTTSKSILFFNGTHQLEYGHPATVV